MWPLFLAGSERLQEPDLNARGQPNGLPSSFSARCLTRGLTANSAPPCRLPAIGGVVVAELYELGRGHRPRGGEFVQRHSWDMTLEW